MIIFILAFLCGDVCIQCLPQLPNITVCFMIASFFLVAFFVCHRHRWRSMCIGMCAGLLWTTWCAQLQMARSYLPIDVAHSQRVRGIIATLPVTDQWGTRFVLVTKAQQAIAVQWRDPSCHLRVGDEWQLTMRLRHIHGTQNPGGFDQEAWSLQHGIHARARVDRQGQQRYLRHHAHAFWLQQWRQHLDERLTPQLPHTETAPWLRALILGEKQGISANAWDVLRNTGTNHLMAIAGLHIAMLTSLIYFVAAWCWRRCAWCCLHLPAQRFAAAAALSGAFAYGALAGFALPTQRACIMCAVVMISSLLRQPFLRWHAWALALGCVLWINPLCVLSDSFWLSFGTIALIIYGVSARLRPQGWWWHWGRAQWVIAIGILPLSVTFFQETSLINFLANCIAIPWLEFGILPWCLLSIVCLPIVPSCARLLLQFADLSLHYLWQCLTWLAAWPHVTYHFAISHLWVLLALLGGVVLLLLPRGVGGRYLGVCWLLPLWFTPIAVPQQGEVWLSVLDVGQGLSVVVQTAQHTLLYDAGPKYADSFDAGARIVLPFLNQQGIKRLDVLVVSHGDNDHSGGVAAVMKQLSPNTFYTSVPARFAQLHHGIVQYCLAPNHWDWEGVHFEFLYPEKTHMHLGNDSSCVLRIVVGDTVILLTGDIERKAERFLLNYSREALAATLLVAPHHGSKTSADLAFVAATHPRYVVYATGYRNRYHFPHHDVVMRYSRIGATQFNTSETGMLQFKLGGANNTGLPMCYRDTHRHYWLHAVTSD